MKIIIKWIITAIMPMVIFFSPLANSAESIHFSTGVFEGGQLALVGSDFMPFGSVEVEVTDPLNGTLNYIESANENGVFEINMIASTAGVYKAVILSGSDTEVTAETTVQGE